MIAPTPKAKDHARGWPKLLRDTNGMRVRLCRDAQNGWIVIPAGTEGVLRSSCNGWHLLEFIADKCEHCKCQPKITRMSWRDFEPIPLDHEQTK